MLNTPVYTLPLLSATLPLVSSSVPAVNRLDAPLLLVSTFSIPPLVAVMVLAYRAVPVHAELTSSDSVTVLFVLIVR
ncbi:hypothetical protein D3C81_1347230 [compost metagenome]